MRLFNRNLIVSALMLIAAPLQSAEPTKKAPDRTIQIVGGTAVPDARYPWMAAVYERVGGTAFAPICGGSLISSRWILSAAHCFVDRDTGQQTDPNDIAFLLGRLDLTSDEGIFDLVSRIVVHPGYNPVGTQNDIALLELSNPVPFEPIPIPGLDNPFPQNGEQATVAGWGATSEGGQQSALLLEVDLPVVSHNACLPFYQNSLDETTEVCAGGSRAGGEDSCQGDSGGPLFVPRGDQLVQAGIVSTGLGCARPGIPGVYTRVSAYFDWITSFVDSPRIYDGSDDADVVAVAEPVEVLTANTRISASVGLGGVNTYQAPGINRLTLETTRGDADLYVFNSAVFTEDTLVCSSFLPDPIDECVLDRVGDYFVAVAGFEDSDYTLTASNGSSEITDFEVVTLQNDQPVSGSLLRDTAAVFRAATGNTATLTSVSGNSDLLVFSSDEINIDNLICISQEDGSAIDTCAYDDSLPEVYIGVFGVTDTSYTLSISSSDSTPEPVVTVESGATDNDADGLGDSGGSSGGGGGSVSKFIALLAFLSLVKYRRRTGAVQL